MRRSAGFTLVELLMALLVLGLLSGLLLSGAGAGQRVWERADRHEGQVDTIAAAQRIVRDRLEGAIPVTLYAARPYTDLTGGPDAVFFYGPPPVAARPDAVVVYRLSRTTGAELALSAVSDLAPNPEQARRDQLLLRNVQRVEFSYFGSTQQDPARRWRDRWAEQPLPPELIRVRVTLARGDARHWPDLIVRPAANVDLNCVLNFNTGGCKGR